MKSVVIEYPIIALITGSLVIVLNLNLIIHYSGKGRYCILPSFRLSIDTHNTLASHYRQATHLPVIYQLHISLKRESRRNISRPDINIYLAVLINLERISFR